jgi:hypothetical protein
VCAEQFFFILNKISFIKIISSLFFYEFKNASLRLKINHHVAMLQSSTKKKEKENQHHHLR